MVKPLSLSQKTDTYWNDKQEKLGPAADTIKDQVTAKLQGFPKSEDGRFKIDVGIHYLIPQHGQDDPRIMWVNSKGEEVNKNGNPITAYAAKEAPPEAPKAEGQPTTQAAKKFAPTPPAAKPPPLSKPELTEEGMGKVLDLILPEGAEPAPGYKAMGGTSFPHNFRVHTTEFRALAEFDSKESALAMSGKLSEEGPGDFGVVKVHDTFKGSEHFLILAPNQMSVLNSYEGKLPFDVSIEE